MDALSTFSQIVVSRALGIRAMLYTLCSVGPGKLIGSNFGFQVCHFSLDDMVDGTG